MKYITKNLLIVYNLCDQTKKKGGKISCECPFKVHTDERTQVHSTQSSLAVTHRSTNRARPYLTSVTVSPSKHW